MSKHTPDKYQTAKEKNMTVLNSDLTPTMESLLEENAKLNAALNCFFIVDPDKPSAWEYTREQAEAMARAALEPIEKLKGGGQPELSLTTHEGQR